jgi:hypothetical protein
MNVMRMGATKSIFIGCKIASAEEPVSWCWAILSKSDTRRGWCAHRRGGHFLHGRRRRRVAFMGGVRREMSTTTKTLQDAPGRFTPCQDTVGWLPMVFNHPLKGKETVLGGGQTRRKG